MTNTSNTESDVADLMKRAVSLQVGTCSCLVKTPVVEHHDINCKYRIAVELIGALESLSNYQLHAAADLRARDAEIERLQRVIAWANNSLHGSHGFFIDPEKGEHHLDQPIEELKTLYGKEYQRAEALERENISDREALASMMLNMSLATGHGDTISYLVAELQPQIEQLQRERCPHGCVFNSSSPAYCKVTELQARVDELEEQLKLSLTCPDCGGEETPQLEGNNVLENHVKRKRGNRE